MNINNMFHIHQWGRLIGKKNYIKRKEKKIKGKEVNKQQMTSFHIAKKARSKQFGLHGSHYFMETTYPENRKRKSKKGNM